MSSYEGVPLFIGSYPSWPLSCSLSQLRIFPTQYISTFNMRWKEPWHSMLWGPSIGFLSPISKFSTGQFTSDEILIVWLQHSSRFHLPLSLLRGLGRRLEGTGGTRSTIHRIAGLRLCIRSIPFDGGRVWSRLEIHHSHLRTQRNFDWPYWWVRITIFKPWFVEIAQPVGYGGFHGNAGTYSIAGPENVTKSHWLQCEPSLLLKFFFDWFVNKPWIRNVSCTIHDPRIYHHKREFCLLPLSKCQKGDLHLDYSG